MRITDANIYSTLMQDLNQQLARQLSIQKSISTGKIVNAPSDSPLTSTTILNARSDIREISQYFSNLENAGAWLTASEDHLDSAVDTMNRLKTLAEQMATGTYQKSEQEGVASEVNNLIAQLITIANSKDNGTYYFSGSAVQSPAMSSVLTPSDQPILVSRGWFGHDTTASALADGAAYDLTLGRGANGGTLTISNANTLGENGGLGLNFDGGSWSVQQYAGSFNGQSNRLDLNLALTDDVSVRTGETFSWNGDADAGTQTYITQASVSFSGAVAGGVVEIDDGVNPPFTYTVAGATDQEMAQNLAEQINAEDGDFFAYTQDDTVYIMTKPSLGGVMTVSEDTAAVGMTVAGNVTLDQFTSELNAGRQAVGTVHIDNASLPNIAWPGGDTITLDGVTYTWQEITGGTGAGDADACASQLADFINSHTDTYTASVTTAAGNGATVVIQARAVGAAGNTSLSATGGVITSGAILGGFDGADTETDGKLYATGTSDLRLETNVRAEVISVDGKDVTVRLRWYDTDGAAQTQDVTLSEPGENAAVKVSGLGEIYLYKDSGDYHEGAVFDVFLGHYQGNEEDLNVLFSDNKQMAYNINAKQFLGGPLSVDLWDAQAGSSTTNTGTGEVGLTGVYRGTTDRTYNFEVVDAGQVPTDEVTLRVRWVDSVGVEQTELMTFDLAGRDHAISLPDGEGGQIYLDGGTFNQGDSFSYTVEKSYDVAILDQLQEWAYQLEHGSVEEAQEASQKALEVMEDNINHITDLIATVGGRSKRIELRETVMENQELTHSGTLEELQDVNLTDAFMKLNLFQEAYQSSLKISAMISQMSVLDYIG